MLTHLLCITHRPELTGTLPLSSSRQLWSCKAAGLTRTADFPKSILPKALMFHPTMKLPLEEYQAHSDDPSLNDNFKPQCVATMKGHTTWKLVQSWSTEYINHGPQPWSCIKQRLKSCKSPASRVFGSGRPRTFQALFHRRLLLRHSCSKQLWGWAFRADARGHGHGCHRGQDSNLCLHRPETGYPII